MGGVHGQPVQGILKNRERPEQHQRQQPVEEDHDQDSDAEEGGNEGAALHRSRLSISIGVLIAVYGSQGDQIQLKI